MPYKEGCLVFGMSLLPLRRVLWKALDRVINYCASPPFSYKLEKRPSVILSSGVPIEIAREHGRGQDHPCARG